MKPCRSFAVYPALLDVMCARARVRVAESGGFGALRCPLTLFHASFLPICSTFPHSSPLPNSASLSIPLLSSPPPQKKKIPHPPTFVTAAAAAAQSKICKRSWVLHECVERVPENVDAAKELLQYGLKGTDLEALIAIGNREDGGR